MRASDNQSFNKFWRVVRILLVRRHTLNRSLSGEINHLQDDAPSLPASVRSAGTIVFFQEFPWLWTEPRGHCVELEI